MRRSFCLLALWAALVVAAVGQPTVPANYTVSLHANGIAATGDSMAVDAWGNVFILDRPTGGPFVSPESITRVSPNGNIDPAYATGLGASSQIAFNPADGKCYAAFNSPILPVVLSTVYRLDASGPVQVGITPLIAAGFTIDDTGRWIFGTSTAVGGPGLYRQDSSTAMPIPLGPGFGNNAILQSIAFSQDVLIADGAEVRRWTPLVINPVPYWSTLVLPNTIVRVTSMGRSPFDQLGRGALIGVNDFTTLCFCGVGSAFPGSPTSGANAAFASEGYGPPDTGLRAIAASIRGSMYWLTDASAGPLAGKTLYRVDEDNGPGIPTSLQVGVTPVPSGSVVNIDVWAGAGSPLLLGAIPVPAVTPGVEVYTSFGWILDIFDPTYIPVVDGPGVFGPPDPFGVVPPGGHWQLMITLPPLGLQLVGQALTEDPTAPNGWFNISNLELVNLP